MTEQQEQQAFKTISNKHFKIQSIETQEDSFDNSKVEKVIFKSSDAPQNQVTYKPRKKVIQEKEQNGITRKVETKEPKSFEELPEIIEKIASVLQEKDSIEVSATVGVMDNSLRENSENNKKYAYIQEKNIDKLKVVDPNIISENQEEKNETDNF